MINITNTPLQPFQNIFIENTRNQLFEAILFVLILTAVLTIIYKITIYILDKITKRTSNPFDDIIVVVLKTIKTPLFFVAGLYIASKTLVLDEIIFKAIQSLSVFIFIYYVTKMTYVFIDHALNKYRDTKIQDESEESHLELIRMFSKVGLICIAVISFLANVGVNVTSLITGLGIGGIAIAFALQQVLSDVFSSLSIHFDKPFEKGDFIIVGDDMGTVRKIGIQTTRIKTLQGQMLSIPNSELSKSRINNYKRMERRRIQFQVGVTYDTPVAKVEKIPKAIEKIITKAENATFDRSHFKEFADSNLTFDTVYFVESKDYVVYMNTQQLINLELMKYFEKNNIEFAFPTQTVHVHKEDAKKPSKKSAKKA